MKYFTPDLIQRINSGDEDVEDAADNEWERALVRYERRWQKIRAAFPETVQRFNDDRICLHDAQLVSMGQQGNTFIMVLHPEPPAQTTVVLTFTLDAEPVIDTAAVPGRPQGNWVDWEYEEWNRDRRGRCTFEVLLGNGWLVKLYFRDFRYLIAERLLPVERLPTQAVTPPERPPVPRSA
jgi:hypothetical protein